MKTVHWFARLLALVVVALSAQTAHARPGCNDAGIFGSSLITDICWSCILPIKMLGVGGGGRDPSGSNNLPMCACDDPLGVPIAGFTFGGWLPYRLFELVRNPFCTPVLGGVFLSDDWSRLAGPGYVQSQDTGSHTYTYYHQHVYSFPLATMLELLTGKHCNPGGYHDMDIIMLSEFDPVAADDMLALFIYFETALFANPTALAACGIECGLISAGFNSSSGGVNSAGAQVWWCAGCWGSLYPLTGSSSVRSSLHTETSLVAARTLAVKHRRGLGQKTYGSDSMCGGTTSVFLPKEQYRWQHLFPVPNARKPCCHWTGTSEVLTGGISRSLPYEGEDAVHMLFRYVDCCMN